MIRGKLVGHTPGPWLMSYGGDHISIIPDIPVYEECIVDRMDGGCSDTKKDLEVEANAALISAAPELLKALEELVEGARALLKSEHFPLMRERTENHWLPNAGLAIEKARGKDCFSDHLKTRQIRPELLAVIGDPRE